MTTEKGVSQIPNTRLQFQTHIYSFKHTFIVFKHTFTVSNSHLHFKTHIYSLFQTRIYTFKTHIYIFKTHIYSFTHALDIRLWLRYPNVESPW